LNVKRKEEKQKLHANEVLQGIITTLMYDVVIRNSATFYLRIGQTCLLGLRGQRGIGSTLAFFFFCKRVLNLWLEE
jgi:hypothetical protein